MHIQVSEKGKSVIFFLFFTLCSYSLGICTWKLSRNISPDRFQIKAWTGGPLKGIVTRVTKYNTFK